MALCGSQPPHCFWTSHSSGTTADICRPGGYFPTTASANAAVSGANAKLDGWTSAGAGRRRDIPGHSAGMRRDRGDQVPAMFSLTPRERCTIADAPSRTRFAAGPSRAALARRCERSEQIGDRNREPERGQLDDAVAQDAGADLARLL